MRKGQWDGRWNNESIKGFTSIVFKRYPKISTILPKRFTNPFQGPFQKGQGQTTKFWHHKANKQPINHPKPHFTQCVNHNKLNYPSNPQKFPIKNARKNLKQLLSKFNAKNSEKLINFPHFLLDFDV